MGLRLLPKRLRNSAFSKQIIVLLSGSVAAQLLPIAASPILTRIYSPDDFGVLALFVAIVSTLTSAANGRYELAIMLTENDSDAINVAAIGAFICACLSALVTILAVCFPATIARAFGNHSLAPWLLLVPVALMFNGLNTSLIYLANRKSQYREIARATAWKAVAMVVTQLGWGAILGAGPAGLVVGQTASAAAANNRLWKTSAGTATTRPKIRAGEMRRLAARFRRFPAFSLPAIVANTLAQQIVTVLISVFFTASSVGQYALVQRVLGTPTTLVGTSVGQVYFKEAADEKRKTGVATRAFRKTSIFLTAIALPTFVVVFLFAPTLFSVIFGSEWRVAGEYARVLTPLFALRFITAALSTTNSIFEQQVVSLVWQIMLLVGSVAAVFAAHGLGADVMQTLVVYSIVGTTMYAILYWITWRIAGGNGLYQRRRSV